MARKSRKRTSRRRMSRSRKHHTRGRLRKLRLSMDDSWDVWDEYYNKKISEAQRRAVHAELLGDNKSREQALRRSQDLKRIRDSKFGKKMNRMKVSSQIRPTTKFSKLQKETNLSPITTRHGPVRAWEAFQRRERARRADSYQRSKRHHDRDLAANLDIIHSLRTGVPIETILEKYSDRFPERYERIPEQGIALPYPEPGGGFNIYTVPSQLRNRYFDLTGRDEYFPFHGTSHRKYYPDYSRGMFGRRRDNHISSLEISAFKQMTDRDRRRLYIKYPGIYYNIKRKMLAPRYEESEDPDNLYN